MRTAARRLDGSAHAAAGDVERRAVVGAGAHERQAERDVDAVLDAEVLHRDQAVVVRHRDDDVELARMPGALRARMKTVSGANGPLASMPSARAAATAGRDDAQLLVAEQAALAGVRVEPGDRDARRAAGPSAPRPRARCGSSRAPRRRSPRRSRWRSDMWIVTSTVAQLVVGQHHAHRRQRAAGGGERLQHLGVAGIADAGRGERLLVDRRGDDAPPPRRACTSAHRALDAARRGGAGARVDAAERRVDQVGRQAVGAAAPACSAAARRPRRRRDRSAPPRACRRRSAPRAASRATSPTTTQPAAASRRERHRDDLRADAAGIAHRHGQQACAHAGLSISMNSVLEPEALGHVRRHRRRAVALGRMVAAGQERDAGLARQVRLRLGDFAGEEGIGAGRDRRLEVALRAAGAPADARERAAVAGHAPAARGRSAAARARPARRASIGAGRAPMKPSSCSPKRASASSPSRSPNCALLPSSGCASSGRW